MEEINRTNIDYSKLLKEAKGQLLEHIALILILRLELPSFVQMGE